VTVNQNADSVVRMFANVGIPDNDELSWGIDTGASVASNVTVVDVRVTLQGLWHEQASDLKITLGHGRDTVVLAEHSGGASVSV
jgi:hypothetical protein